MRLVVQRAIDAPGVIFSHTVRVHHEFALVGVHTGHIQQSRDLSGSVAGVEAETRDDLR